MKPVRNGRFLYFSSVTKKRTGLFLFTKKGRWQAVTGQLDTIKNKEKWLAAHCKIGVITATCRKTKIQRSTVYFWMDNDPEFKAAVANAEQEAVELLEAEARRRAEKGTLKPVFYKGKRCGSIREYSDTLAMFILKAKKPDEYRDRVTNEITTPDGKAPEIKVTFVSPSNPNDT